MTDYVTLSATEADGVVIVTLDHAPVNLLDAPMLGDLARLVGELETSETARVVGLRRADPELFVAHADLHLIQALPRDERPYPTTLEFLHALMDRWCTLPLVTIAQIEGWCRGRGSQLALSLDLRFAALGRAVLGQPEVAIGIIPGGGGT